MARTWFTSLAPGLVLFAALGACGEDTSSTARIGDGCSQDKDCGQAKKCSFGRCHQPCESSEDCQEGTRCVISRTSVSVCQLPDEERCTVKADCLAPLECASDGTCRNKCDSNSDCAKGQSCSNEGLCADAGELQGGAIVPARQGEAGEGQNTGGKASAAAGSTSGGQEASSGSANGGAPKDNAEAGGDTGGGSSSGGGQTGGAKNSGSGGDESTDEPGEAAGGATPSPSGGAGAGADPVVTGITVSNGYATGYGFQGYWYTEALEATLTPKCPSPCFSNSGGSLCVEVTPDSDGGVGLGLAVWNLNQPAKAGPGRSEDTADITSYTTLKIGVEQRAGDELQLIAAVHPNTEHDTGCALIATGMNTIVLRDLTTRCFAPSSSYGESLVDEDLQNATNLLVQATSSSPTPYEFCITHVSFE